MVKILIGIVALLFEFFIMYVYLHNNTSNTVECHGFVLYGVFTIMGTLLAIGVFINKLIDRKK